MKKTLFYLSAVALVLATACNKEVAGPEVPAGKSTVSVSLEGQTKTTLADEVAGARKVLWSEGDQIAINGTASEALAAGGTQTATFSFSSEIAEPTAAQPWNVLYPASVYKDAQTITLPAIQQIAEGDNIVPDVLPMSKQVTKKDITLSHVCGILSIQVEGTVDVAQLVLTANNAEALSGDFAIDYATSALTAAAGASDQVKVNISKNLAEGVAFVNVVVPAGTYADGFNVAVKGADGKSYVKTLSGSKTIVAGHMFVMPAAFGVVAPSFFVTPTGAGEKSGANWENAMDIATFNAALKNTAGIAGSSYYFAEGSYAGLSSTFAVDAKLYGGYPSGLKGTQLTGRNLESHETIFSNTGGERVLGHFTATTAVVNGITFSATTVNKQGAALSVSANGANMTVKNCKFTGLQATQGAALYSANSAVVSMEGCTFTGNIATQYGGAITISAGVNLTVKNCSFSNNTATNYGGGFCQDNASAVSSFENCSFTGNSCNRGGAISDFHGKCTVKACTFTSNTSTGQGAAIQLQNNTANLTVSSSTFTSNTNTNGDGGAIQLFNGTAAVDDCTFDSNVAKFGSAFNINNNACVVKINGCKFTGNQPGAEKRGASVVCLGNGTCMMNDCFISGNGVANEHDGNCIFRAFNGSRLMIANTFIQDNITRSTHAMQQGANTLFANVTMVGEAPAVGLWAPNTLNVWVNTALLNSKGGISVHGNANTSAFNVALKGGCVLQGYDNFGAATVTKTATDVDDAVYADLNVTKNAEGKYVIGNYPAGWAKSSDAEVAEVLKTSFTVGSTNYGQQFYDWLHSINAL